MPKCLPALTIFSADNKFFMPGCLRICSRRLLDVECWMLNVAEIPKPAAIKMRLTCDNDLYFSPFYGTRLLSLLHRRMLHFKSNSGPRFRIRIRIRRSPGSWLLAPPLGFTNLKIASDYTSYAMQRWSPSNRLPFWSSAVCRLSSFCRSTPPLNQKLWSPKTTHWSNLKSQSPNPYI